MISAVLATMILMTSFNAIAYTKSSATGGFDTDKSERTLIKEIYFNQKQTIALLNEIKSMLQASK